jgi:hypothetical protein
VAWFPILMLAAAQLYAADLGAIKNEPNLERRSDLALQNANSALDIAREAYTAGNLDKTEAAVDEVGASVDLAFDSLGHTGKDPRRSPKFFKRAEMSTRQLLRRLDGMMESMSVVDRSVVEKVRDHVADIHENLLKGIMSNKK